MFKDAQLILGGPSGATRELLFSIRATPVAQRWAGCLSLANRHSRIHERDRFYNFPGHRDGDERAIVRRIEFCIDRINESFPGLIREKIDEDDVQGSINRIHIHFADTRLNETLKNEQTRDAWAQLNNSLHAYESFLRSRDTEKSAGIPECNIVVTWERSFHRPLEEEDYGHFTVAKKFGTLYVNYCQVGRHLYEIFLSGDEVLADDHIYPLESVSADTYVWLGSTTGPKSLAMREAKIAKWFEENRAKMNALGFHWGDPRLAIGWIPVADFVSSPSELKDQVRLVTELGGMDRVLSLSAT